MAVATVALSAPHATARKEVQRMGLGSYGGPTAAVAENLKWPGNKRAVLTKFTLADLYEALGTAFLPSALGLKEVHALLVVGSSTTNVLPNNSATAAANAVPTLGGTASAPKVKLLIGGADVTATTDVTGTVFHAIVVGI